MNNHTPLVIALETMLYIVLATVISCSSIIVILVVWRTSALHTPPGFLMIIMSICDLLLSTILAMSTVNVIQRKSVFPTYVNVVLAVMFATFQNGNAMALMVSAIDQLISILKPLQYPSISTPKRILTVFISMLAFSVLFVIFLVFMAYKYTVEQEKKGETGTVSNYPFWYTSSFKLKKTVRTFCPMPKYLRCPSTQCAKIPKKFPNAVLNNQSNFLNFRKSSERNHTQWKLSN